MKKTGDEVLNDLYKIVRDSGLLNEINGSLYKDGTMRPLNSNQEDAIISFKTGLDGQIQDGAAVINIYIPDIDSGAGGKSKNSSRTAAVSKKALELFNNKVLDEYYFYLGNMIQTFREEEIGQHFVSVDLRFKLTTF